MIHLITTRAKERSCRCGAAILVGIAEGMPVRADARPVTPAEEIAALVEGRWTFALRCGELVHRDAIRIRGGYVGQSVHAQHRCAAYTQPSLIGATA
jgi:hypothetical protein